jgi:hypothetical protein
MSGPVAAPACARSTGRCSEAVPSPSAEPPRRGRAELRVVSSRHLCPERPCDRDSCRPSPTRAGSNRSPGAWTRGWTAMAATASAQPGSESEPEPGPGSDLERASQREVPAWQPQAAARPERSRQARAEVSASVSEPERVQGPASASDAASAPASHAASPSHGSELCAWPARRAERPAVPWAGERSRARHAPSRPDRSELRCASEPSGDALKP